MARTTHVEIHPLVSIFLHEASGPGTIIRVTTSNLTNDGLEVGGECKELVEVLGGLTVHDGFIDDHFGP